MTLFKYGVKLSQTITQPIKHQAEKKQCVNSNRCADFLSAECTSSARLHTNHNLSNNRQTRNCQPLIAQIRNYQTEPNREKCIEIAKRVQTSRFGQINALFYFFGSHMKLYILKKSIMRERYRFIICDKGCTQTNSDSKTKHTQTFTVYNGKNMLFAAYCLVFQNIIFNLMLI